MQPTLKNYTKLLAQIQKTIKKAETNVNREKVVVAWQIGKIIDRHLGENNQAKYGEKLFEQLEKDTAISKSILYQMCSFYQAYPTLPKSNLSWSHYRSLASIEDKAERKYLEDFSVKNDLGAETLQKKVAQLKKVKKKTTAPKKVLNRPRGKLFTYELSQQILKRVQDAGKSKGSKSTAFVDCGFNIFTEIKTALAADGIVESKKLATAYSLKKSNLDRKQLHTYKAYIERVIDGDSLHVVLDLGFKIQHREILRLAKIGAEELATNAGQKTFHALQKILKNVPFVIIKTNKTDIYGRYVADVFFSESETDPQKVADEGVYLNQLLLDRGLVELY